VALGLENTPQEYVENLVGIFGEAKRVLRVDGTFWLNLGDSFASARAGHSYEAHTGIVPESRRGKAAYGEFQTAKTRGHGGPRDANYIGLKHKDLIGIPWMVAFALRDDGWYLRRDIIWAKGNCMPESVRDRCTTSHEYVFMFAHPDSGGRYFYDAHAIREPISQNPSTQARNNRQDDANFVGSSALFSSPYGQSGTGFVDRKKGTTRNKRSVWNVNPRPYKGAHFATWPPALVEHMIKAGTSEYGCCPKCGVPWGRKVRDPDCQENTPAGEGENQQVSEIADSPMWKLTCECGEEGRTRAIVLDPFSGAATSGRVAFDLNRDFIGIDCNAEYLALAQSRLLLDPPPSNSDGESAEEWSVVDLLGDPINELGH